MICVGILNTSGISPSDSSVISKIPEEARGRVEKTRSERDKANRLGAYLLLASLCESIFNEKNLQILYTDKGKPYLSTPDFVNNSSQTLPNISVSHDGEISCVALCDDNFDIGIDVQSENADIKCEAVAKRFFDKITALKGDSQPLVKGLVSDHFLLNRDVFVRYFDYRDGCIFEVPYSEFLSEEGTSSQIKKLFLKKWTYLESHLKMAGEGFSGISSFDEITLGAECGCMEFFKRKKFYSLSVSVKESQAI